MKRTFKIIALPALVVLSLVGCSNDPKPVTQSNHAQYLDHLESVGITQQPGQNLIGAGEEICRWFDEGQTAYEVMLTLSYSKVDAQTAGSILAAALTDLCPEYSQEMLDVGR